MTPVRRSQPDLRVQQLHAARAALLADADDARVLSELVVIEQCLAAAERKARQRALTQRNGHNRKTAR